MQQSDCHGLWDVRASGASHTQGTIQFSRKEVSRWLPWEIVITSFQCGQQVHDRIPAIYFHLEGFECTEGTSDECDSVGGEAVRELADAAQCVYSVLEHNEIIFKDEAAATNSQSNPTSNVVQHARLPF